MAALEEREKNSHSLHLASNRFIESPFGLRIIRKDYSRTSFYHYNTASVTPTLEFTKSTYPMVYEAIQRTITEELTVDILFNAPKDHWTLPPDTGNSNNGRVRIRIKSELLKQLHSVCGYNLTISLHGYIYRNTFRSGQRIPFSLENNGTLVFNVNEDGTTNEKSTNMMAGLLGQFECSGIFTLIIRWEGPEMLLPGAKRVAESLLWSCRDFKIISRTKKPYYCSSKLLIELSPVFDAMLSTSMIEKTSGEINLEYGDSTVEAFLKYANTGSIHGAFTCSNTCLKLFLFGHKYQIKELETATLLLLRGKTRNWFSTETALKLYCYISTLPGLEDLAEKTYEILESRKEEVHLAEGFEKLSLMFPKLKQVFVESIEK